MLSIVLVPILAVVLPFIWTFPFILTSIIGLRLNHTKNGSVIFKVAKEAKFASYYIDSIPRGLMVGRYFVAFIYEKSRNNSDQTEAFVLTTNFHRFTIDDTADDGKYLCASIGNISWEPTMSYCRVKASGPMYPWQAELITEVIEYFALHDVCTVLISGDTKVGKSEVAGILAEFLGVTRVDNYRPTFPFSLNKVRELTETKDGILIVSMEEFDSLLDGEGPPSNKYNLADVYGKSTWNVLMDGINKGIYGKLIVIATTNKPLDDFPDQSMINGSRFKIRREIWY